jgi:hypothetical protein
MYRLRMVPRTETCSDFVTNCNTNKLKYAQQYVSELNGTVL